MCQRLLVKRHWSGWAGVPIFRKDERLHVSHRSLLWFADFRHLLTGQFVSQVADAAASLVIARELLFTGSDGPTPELLMQAVVSAAVPLFLGGPMGGLLSDRWPRQRLLVAGQVVRALLVGAVAVSLSVGATPALLLCFVLLQCLARVLYTARAAAVRHVVRQHELIVADSTVLIAGVVAGLGGVVLSVASMRVHSLLALLVAALLHVAASYRFDAIRTWLGGDGRSPTLKWRFAFAQFRCGKTRYSLLATSLHRFGVGVVLASTALLLDDELRQGASGYALALSAAGAGSFVGSMSAEALNERIPHKSLTVMAYLAAGSSVAVAVVVGSPTVMVASLGLSALSFQVLRIASDATIQANALKGSCGRVFAVYDIVFNSSFLAGLMAGLALSDTTSPQTATAIVPLFFVLAGVVFAVMPRTSASFSDTRGSAHPTTRNRMIFRPST